MGYPAESVVYRKATFVVCGQSLLLSVATGQKSGEELLIAHASGMVKRYLSIISSYQTLFCRTCL